MEYRIKVLRASGDLHSITVNSTAKLHGLAQSLRDAYPVHTMVIQRQVMAEWEDYRIIDEFGGFKI